MKTDNSAKKVNSVKKERREKKEKLTIEKRILQTIIFGKCIVYSSGRCDGMVYPFPFFVD